MTDSDAIPCSFDAIMIPWFHDSSLCSSYPRKQPTLDKKKKMTIQQWLETAALLALGSFRNYYGEGNKDGKKAVG